MGKHLEIEGYYEQYIASENHLTIDTRNKVTTFLICAMLLVGCFFIPIIKIVDAGAILPCPLGTVVTNHYVTAIDVNSAGRYGTVDAANPFANMQDGDVDFTRIYEEDDAGIPPVQHVADGNFLNAEINTEWPLTLTGGFFAGASFRDTVTATSDGSGSMTARTNEGKKIHFQGYREEYLASTIAAGKQTTLTLNYKKTWIAEAPTTQSMSVVALYSGGTTATIWNETVISNSNVWTSVTQPFVPTGIVTAIRLQFDILNSGTSNDVTRYGQVWFDDVTLTVFTPNCRMDTEATIAFPSGDTYELQMLVMPTGENVELYVYDSLMGWPPTASTTFIAGVWTTYNETIFLYEWDVGNVFVRFTDATKTGDQIQNMIDIQYLRVQVTIIDTEAPIADAGPNQIVDVGTSVTFNGSGSSDNEGITNYWWNFTDSGAQSLVGVGPTYTFNVPGNYPVTLTVMDIVGNTGIDEVIISVYFSPIIQNINISIGWNFISFAVIPETAGLADVFQDEWTNIECIQFFDSSSEEWKVYERSAPPWLNSLKSVDNTKGYWIKMSAINDGVLSISGTPPGVTTIQLKKGWNMVGFPSETTVSSDVVLAGTGFDGLQCFDGSSLYDLRDMLFTESFVQGQAYWVHVPEDTSFIVYY